jgi:cell volume regulation protein A
MTFLTSGNILLIGSILIFSSIIITKAGGRFGVPALLLFLLAGMLFGVDGIGIVFNNVRQAQFVGMIALCVILFAGGMETKFADIKPILGPGLTLSTLGVVITTALTGGFIFLLSEWHSFPLALPLATCFLLAATMSSTDSASVFNILRSKNIRLKNNLQPMLELESGSNDPMAYILTIVLIQLIQSLYGASTADIGVSGVIVNSLVVLIQQFTVGILIGAAMGYAGVWILNKIELKNVPLNSILLLSLVFFTFAFTDMLGGNGYLAVYLTGILIGNNKVPYRKQILSFLDSLTWIVQIGMFLLLGLLVNPSDMLRSALPAIAIGVFMMLVARPISIFVSLIPFRKIGFPDKLFLSWVGLRGAVPIIFAMYPVVEKIPGSETIFDIVFFITLLSLIIQGSTMGTVARKLDLVLPPVEEKQFDLDLPDEAGELREMTITAEVLAEKGSTLKDFQMPKGLLVLFIKRNERFIVPNGSFELREGDHMLIVAGSDYESE